MATNFQQDAIDARKDILENGRLLPIFRSSPVFDNIEGKPNYLQADAQGEIAAITLTRYKGTIFEEYDQAFKDGLVVGKSKLFLAAAHGATFTPEIGDYIGLENAHWVIKGVSALDLNGTPILYYIGACRQ